MTNTQPFVCRPVLTIKPQSRYRSPEVRHHSKGAPILGNMSIVWFYL